MTQAPLREIRRYRALSQRAAAARDATSLADIAVRTERGIAHWLLLELMKDDLAQRARRLGIPCRADPELCFEYLLELGRPQLGLFRENNAARDEVSSSLTDWAIVCVREVKYECREAEGFQTRVETDDERPLDVDLDVKNFWPRLDVMGRFGGPVDHDAAARWAGLIQIEICIEEQFDDWTELRTILARTVRHELEHAHDVGVPQMPAPKGLSELEAFQHYILSPREVSAWSAHIADEAARERLDLRNLLVANGQIVEGAALKRGATAAHADRLATMVVSAWSQALGAPRPAARAP